MFSRLISAAGVLAAVSFAQQQQPQAVSRPDIRTLIEISGGMETISEFMKPETMERQMRLAMRPESAPPEQRPKVERFITEFAKEFAAEAQARRAELIDLSVEIYSKYYTPDDIQALIAFYKSPAGKKFVTEGRKAALESMEAGQKWGQALGQQIGARVSQRIEAESKQEKKP